MGHPEPFGLEYLGLGNEQWETPESDFYRRFEIFSARVHEKYPDIKIIGTVGPDVETPRHKEAWEWTRANLARDPKFVYAADEHFYVPPQWMYDHVTMYDGYPARERCMRASMPAMFPAWRRAARRRRTSGRPRWPRRRS